MFLVSISVPKYTSQPSSSRFHTNSLSLWMTLYRTKSISERLNPLLKPHLQQKYRWSGTTGFVQINLRRHLPPYKSSQIFWLGTLHPLPGQERCWCRRAAGSQEGFLAALAGVVSNYKATTLFVFMWMCAWMLDRVKREKSRLWLLGLLICWWT